MKDLDQKIIELMDLFDDEQVTTADKIDRPQQALEKEAIDDFMKRNPMAGGGMLVQPGFGGTRQGYAKDKAPIGSEIRKITKKTSPYYGKWAYRVIENGERVTKYSDIKPKSPDTSPKHPYVNSKDFQKFLEEYKITNPDWNPKKGYAAILDKYERQLARKNKIVGIVELAKVLGEDNPYTERTLVNILSKRDKKITKNMSKKEIAQIKHAKRVYKIFEDALGAPSKFSDTLNQYKYIRDFPSEKRYQSAWDYSPSKIKKLNKSLNKFYNRVGDLQASTIDNMFKFLNNENLINEINNYKGGSITQDSPIFKNLLKEYKGGKDPSYAFMQLGRALRGEIQIDGIEKNVKLGNRIIKLTADNYKSPLGTSFLEWAKLQMAKDFDDPSNTYRSLTGTIKKSMKNIGITDLSGLAIDEIFPARTGQLTLKGSGAYNQIIQFIDGEINSKAKSSFDGRSSIRYQEIIDNIKNKNFDAVQEIVNKHNTDINNFYEKYPQAKGKVKLTKLNYDSANKRFLSPTEIYGADVLPSKILKGMEKFYAKTGLSLDVGSTMTLEKAAEGLSGNKKQQSEILRKMGFKCKYAKADGGRIRLKKGTLGKCDDPENYVEDINKTRADLNSNDVTVRAAANAKLNNGLNIAKKLPDIGTFLRRAGQATVGTVSSALKALGFTSPVGYAIEGMVEGGVYDYFRKQGYTHDQAYAETFTPGLITGRPEGVPWYGGAESLLEKELLGSGFQQNPKVLQYQKALEDQQQIYDAFADKQRGIKAQRKDITDAASADIQDAYRSGMVSRVNQIMNPESMASQAYQTAVEKQMGAQDQRAKDYMDKNYVQREPSEFMQNKLQEERNKAMLELFPPPTVNQIREAYTEAGYKDFLPLLKAEDYKKEMKLADDRQKQSYFADNFRLEKAGGGIAKLAGVDQGPPPKSGPMSEGLQGLMKRGIKT
jgi:hypothetical protein